MEVKFKNTVLGPVPEDWRVLTFQQVISGFTSGQTPSRSRPDYYKGDILWITSGELNYNRIENTAEKITHRAVAENAMKILPEGTFLIAITGLEAEGTRGSCGITAAPATTNQSCMALFVGKELLPDYLFHFYVHFGERLALKYCQGTKQQSYSSPIVRNLPIILPPSIQEQYAIAGALTDCDLLIASINTLINKKTALRTATMQALLSAQKRIDGFDKPWEKKTLSQICRSITTGKLDANAMVPSGTYRFYTCAREFYHIDHYAFDKEALLISGNGSNLGYIHYYKGKFNAYQRTYVLSEFSENIHFIKAYLDLYLKERIAMQVNAGNTPYIRRDTLSQMKIKIPTDKKEQKAIADIIQHIDLQIQTIKDKLLKYQNIKLAMMQQLLNGNSRI